MRTHLFLAAFWFLGAIVVFGYPWWNQVPPAYTILGSDWSIGWLLLVFSAWNLVRFVMTRAAMKASSEPNPPPPNSEANLK